MLEREPAGGALFHPERDLVPVRVVVVEHGQDEQLVHPLRKIGLHRAPYKDSLHKESLYVADSERNLPAPVAPRRPTLCRPAPGSPIVPVSHFREDGCRRNDSSSSVTECSSSPRRAKDRSKVGLYLPPTAIDKQAGPGWDGSWPSDPAPPSARRPSWTTNRGRSARRKPVTCRCRPGMATTRSSFRKAAVEITFEGQNVPRCPARGYPDPCPGGAGRLRPLLPLTPGRGTRYAGFRPHSASLHAVSGTSHRSAGATAPSSNPVTLRFTSTCRRARPTAIAHGRCGSPSPGCGTVQGGAGCDDLSWGNS